MINVIRKQSTNDTVQSTISSTDIEALVVDESIILLEPVKQTIEITYDAKGYADKALVNLGTQYDHRVTWLRFNLDRLIWNLDEKRNYTHDTKFNHYTFKLAFSKIGEEAENASIWEFDGVDFEVPRGITKEAGLYKIVLIIEEFQDSFDGNPSGSTQDLFQGNISDNTPEKIERFVAAEVKGKVNTSFYSPEYDITADITETDQTAALVKPKIQCTLTDSGKFSSEEIELGQQYDNFIRYLKFNPRQITAHLNDFYVFAIFKKGDLFYSSLFEKTHADDPLDDYSVSYPIIAWVPSGVYQNAGTWQVAIIAFAGNINDLNENKDNGDYYFYVSDGVKMKVVKNSLSKNTIDKTPTLSITTNLTSSLGEVIITKDDEIYQAKQQ